MSSRAFRRSAVVLLLALASRAWTTTYCVDVSDSSCDVNKMGSDGLAQALDAAALTSDDDTIQIGPDTYLGPYVYMPSGDAGTLTIIGSGSDKTTVSVPVSGAFGPVLWLARDDMGHAAKVSKLAIVIQPSAIIGIQTDGLVEDARIASVPPNGGRFGVELFGTGSGIRRCQIEMSNVPQSTGVESDPGNTLSLDPEPAFIEDSSVLDGVATVRAFAPLRITRCRVSAGGSGSSAIAARGTDVTVEDSLVLVGGGGAFALRAESQMGAGSLLVRQVTAVSVGATPTFAGISVDAEGPNASADVRHSIIRGFKNSTARTAVMNASATVAFSASDYPFDAHLVQGPGTTTLTEPEPNIDMDPLFVDELGGNYQLSNGSPAIDASYSPPLAAGESPTDVLGAPRIQDGNGDGIAARDMGAFEHPALTQPTTTTTTTTIIGAITTTTISTVATTAPPVTTTTLPCTTPRCLFDAALHGTECAGADVPKKIITKIDGAVGLVDRAGTSSGKKQRRLLSRARQTLDVIGRAAAHASKGKKAHISAPCSAAINGAASAVRDELSP